MPEPVPSEFEVQKLHVLIARLQFSQVTSLSTAANFNLRTRLFIPHIGLLLSFKWIFCAIFLLGRYVCLLLKVSSREFWHFQVRP